MAALPCSQIYLFPSLSLIVLPLNDSSAAFQLLWHDGAHLQMTGSVNLHYQPGAPHSVAEEAL